MSGCPVRQWLSERENLRFLRAVVWRLVRTQQDVDEVFSLTVERMLHRSCTYEGEVEKVGAWARSVAQTTAINYLKRDFSHRSVEWLERDETSEPSVISEIIDEEAEEEMEQVILPSLAEFGNEATTLELMWREGMMTTASLEARGINRNTAHGALRRARKRAQELLSPPPQD
jgi:RNA polymerase sigma factor (sigma-70 family)